MHGIHCIQSESIAPRCLVSTAFNGDPFSHAAWYTLRSIRMHFTTLHGIHCIQSHCMESTAFNRDVWAMLYKIHCIQSRCIWPRCMDSTAHNCDPLRHNEWNTLYSMTLHAIHCIQSGCILPGCMESTAFNPTAWNPLHSIGMHFTRLHGSAAFNHAAWTPLHSITLHRYHCIQLGYIGPRCMESTAFNQNPLHHTALNPLHSIEINWATLHRIHCIQWGSI